MLRYKGLALTGVALTLLAVAVPAFATAKEKILYNFCSLPNCADGDSPNGSLIFDGSGNLYGASSNGGSQCPELSSDGCGVVFELSPSAGGKWIEKILHTFCPAAAAAVTANCDDGAIPLGGLTLDNAGNLYGTTAEGGIRNRGVVFRLSPQPDGIWNETVLYRFGPPPDGNHPNGGLVFDAAGNLYGTTVYGGGGGYGAIFQLTPGNDGNWSEKLLYKFRFPEGFYSYAGLTIDQLGTLYGTTIYGGAHFGGTIFKLSRDADGKWIEKTLWAFDGFDGDFPTATLFLDASGNLYGTAGAGVHYGGVVFELSRGPHGGFTEAVLRSFFRFRGPGPSNGVVLDGAANVYGATYFGGGNRQCYGGCGAAFELTQDGSGNWAEITLHSFGEGKHDGTMPVGTPILDAAGNLYGLTSSGGDANGGTVFEITP